VSGGFPRPNDPENRSSPRENVRSRPPSELTEVVPRAFDYPSARGETSPRPPVNGNHRSNRGNISVTRQFGSESVTLEMKGVRRDSVISVSASKVSVSSASKSGSSRVRTRDRTEPAGSRKHSSGSATMSFMEWVAGGPPVRRH
jgi:hypothetical protein